MSLLTLTPLKGLTWTPASKSGLAYWFKADSITGLNDGDPVSTWVDSSGVFANATQTGSNRPVYKTAQLNGQPGVQFTAASNQYMTCGNTVVGSWATNAALSYFAVLKYTNQGGSNVFSVFLSLSTNTTATDGVSKRPIAGYFSESAASYAPWVTAYPDSVAQPSGIGNSSTFTSFASLLVNYNGANPILASSYTLYKNFSSVASTLNAGNSSQSNTLSLLGAWGGSGIAGLYYNGVICETGGWNSQCDATDRTNLAAYILNKYGV